MFTDLASQHHQNLARTKNSSSFKKESFTSSHQSSDATESEEKTNEKGKSLFYNNKKTKENTEIIIPGTSLFTGCTNIQEKNCAPKN